MDDDNDFAFEFVGELFEAFLAQEFLSEGDFTTMFGLLQGVPGSLQGVHADPVLRSEAGLFQRRQLRVDGEIQRFDFTPLFVPVKFIKN